MIFEHSFDAVQKQWRKSWNKWTSQDVLAALGYVLICGICYAACYLAIGAPFAYGGGVFTTVVIYIVAQIAGFLFQLIRLPALLGMLLSGMVLVNALPDLVKGLPSSWSSGFRALALGTIFLRSGLELDLKVFKRVGPVATRLLLIPGLVEAATDAGMAIAVFGMPVFYAFTLGFILKAVGPAIVIQTMFELQTGGWGVAKGIPSTVVAAASFDDMVAITGYSLFSNLAIRNPDSSLAWQLLHGPLDIILGTVAGLVGATFCSCTKLWNTRMKRVAVVFFTAQGLLFLLYEFGFKAGGALSALVLGLVANVLWAQGRHVPLIKRIPGYLSSGPNEHISHEVERVVGVFWRWVAQPLLFGIIGTLMNFRKEGFVFSYIPKALAIIAVGLTVRMPTTFLVMGKAGLTIRERLFVAFAWTPKATVQAALGALPLTSIIDIYGPDSPDVVYGDMILTTSIFAILIAAPLGVLLIQFTHKRLLKQMDVVLQRPSRRNRTFATVGTQYDPDDISNAAADATRLLSIVPVDQRTDAQTDDLKPEEALRRRMLSDSMARRRLAARRRISHETAVITLSSSNSLSAVANQASGSTDVPSTSASHSSDAARVAVATTAVDPPSVPMSRANTAPTVAGKVFVHADKGAAHTGSALSLADQGDSDEGISSSSKRGMSASSAGLKGGGGVSGGSASNLQGLGPLQGPLQVPRSASAPMGLPLTAAAAMATAGVRAATAATVAAGACTGSGPDERSSSHSDLMGPPGVVASSGGAEGASSSAGGASSSRAAGSGGVVGAGTSIDGVGSTVNGLAGAAGEHISVARGTASGDAGGDSGSMSEQGVQASKSRPADEVQVAVPSANDAEQQDPMHLLTMQDVLQQGSVQTVDEALARYFAETERVIDMVEGGQLSAEAGHAATIKLRATLRTVCRQLAEQPKMLDAEVEGAAEDRELATTFFRMADQIVLPTEATAGPPSGTTSRAASVELSHVAVAPAG